MQYYLDCKKMNGKRSEYINKLTRNKVNTIISARSRMLNIKHNYKNAHKDLKCRLCNTDEETQKHILEECQNLKDVTAPITKQMIFNENVTELNEISKMINKRMNIVENI